MSGNALKPRKGALTREVILRAAQECFTQASYDHVTMVAIAEHAGVNVALINRYFGSKEGLFKEAVVSGYQYPVPLRGLQPVEAIKKLVELSCSLVAPGAVDIVLAHLRSIAVEPAQSLLRVASESQFINSLASILPGEDALLRAELITSILFGIRIRRDIVEATALNQLTGDALAEWITPIVIQISGLADTTKSDGDIG